MLNTIYYLLFFESNFKLYILVPGPVGSIEGLIPNTAGDCTKKAHSGAVGTKSWASTGGAAVNKIK